MNAFPQKLDELINSGWNVDDPAGYVAWTNRVASVLKIVNVQAAADFERLTDAVAWRLSRPSQLGMLEGLSLKAEMSSEMHGSAAEPVLGNNVDADAVGRSRKVFVVHGHDSEAKEMVARAVERFGLEAIILHEQPNAGRTVIEKFEQYTDVGFAVVLLTPDDVGSAKGDGNNPQPRARQNVVLELGYFLGKLTRSRVCALYKKGVEIPSDFDGVLYVELDDGGAWRTKLAQELSNARVPINLDALLKI